MQKLLMYIRPRRVVIGILLDVLLLCALAAALYMNFTLGLASTPLQELPPLFLILLFLPLISILIVNVFGSSTSAAKTHTEITYARRSLVAWLGIGGVSIIWAFVNNLTHPQWGGNTAIFFAAGCINLLGAYAFYRRVRVLK